MYYLINQNQHKNCLQKNWNEYLGELAEMNLQILLIHESNKHIFSQFFKKRRKEKNTQYSKKLKQRGSGFSIY